MARSTQVRSAHYAARLPRELPERRGQRQFISYDESRTWLWQRLRAGDRDVANALYYWARKAPKGVKRLPKQLDHLAIQSAATWVRSHMPRVAYFVALKSLAGKN